MILTILDAAKILNLIPFRRYNKTPPPYTYALRFLQVFLSFLVPSRRKGFAVYVGNAREVRLSLGNDLRVCKVDVEFIAIVLGFFLGLSPRSFRAIQ